MATMIRPPDPHALIPPLLAALPTSFASAKPPPAILTLLSPILQQRLQIHTSTPGSNHDSWLRLLCWDKAKAEKLKETVENANFEPHPSSGEMEIGDIGTLTYKRSDAETIRVQIPLTDWELTALYLWCGEAGEGSWKLAELLPFDSSLISDSTWSVSLEQVAAEPTEARSTSTKPFQNLLQRKISTQSDDAGYWAMYDSPYGQTPARQSLVNQTSLPGVSENDYFARYGSVQPAMDNHDPDEEQTDVDGTTLDGRALQPAPSAEEQAQRFPRRNFGHPTIEEEDVVHVNHPVPSSPSSRAGSDTVSRLEESAERFTASDIAIRQHISATMKSMYRLAKASGISRDDFDEMVQRELETLSIFDADD